MPRFSYVARGASGEVVRGFEIAGDEFALDRLLSESDLLLVRATPEARKRGGATSIRALIDFSYHLAICVESGIPIIQGLRDLCEGDHPLHAVAAEVTRRVEAGSSLGDALAEHPRHFPPLMVGLVRAGEESGSLDRVLHDLASHLEWRENLGRQIRGAALYPVMVMLGIVALGAVLGTWVLPAFLNIFEELGASLPPTTRALVAIHAFFSNWWLALLIGGVATGAGCAALLRVESVRLRVDRWVLRMPLFGQLATMIDMSRFSHNLSILLGSGMPILRSLAMVEQVVGNRAIRSVLIDGREQVEQGATLTDGLGRNDLLPPLVMRMLSVGEVSGRLEQSLGRVAAYYDREVPAVVERALAVFNSAVLVLLGGTLVLVALSIFAPLYQAMGEISAG